MVEAQSCGTILWLCDSVERTTARVNWKTENLSLHYAKAPQPIDTKIGVKYYVSDIYQHTKLHHNLLNSFFPHVREENASKMFTGFLESCTSLHQRPSQGFSVQKLSKTPFSRKGVPFPGKAIISVN